ncbi:DUF3429 domain-containing protein [Maricaulis sp.]|uniref:DUF3429 domain-containing protein n=1 Tax=Maricaulis sp. TaxID=1486257 RepID=UPI002B2668D5|nr:DUF3429 domain-containing protein [Maricaulis sp.]
MTHVQRLPGTPLWLGLAGWLPFWIPVGLTAQAAMSGRSAAAEAALFLVYAAIILGFLGGVRWGQALSDENSTATTYTLSILSSLAGLAATLLVWAGAPLTGFALVLASLFLHWRWDARSARQGVLPAWYGRLRSILTLGACAAAIAMMVLYPLTT